MLIFLIFLQEKFYFLHFQRDVYGDDAHEMSVVESDPAKKVYGYSLFFIKRKKIYIPEKIIIILKKAWEQIEKMQKADEEEEEEDDTKHEEEEEDDDEYIYPV